MADETLTTTDDETPDTRLLAQLAELGVEVEKLRDSDEWMAWLKMMSRLHRYSFGNQLLIGFQCPTATYVAGFNRWKALKRSVRKGEKGIKILAPRFGRKDDDGARKIIGFGTAHVFDVAQTDGEELPIQPEWPMVTGSSTVSYVELVTFAVNALNVKVLTPHPAEHNLDARGWFAPAGRTIWVRDRMVNSDGEMEPLAEAEMIATLLHELGHAMDPGLLEDFDMASKELVAESVCYVVGQALGLELDDAVKHYLAGWGGSAERLVWVGRRISAAVKAIEAAMHDHNEEESA